jgi:16S rRNA (guanine1207-N2)-methyltransferase
LFSGGNFHSHQILRAVIRRGVNPALETLLLPFQKDELKLAGRGIFLGAQPHEYLRGRSGWTGWQPYKPLADAWDATRLPRTDHPEDSWPMVLLLPGKSRDEILAGFAQAHDLLEPGGLLVVAIPNTAGAARFEKELSKATPLVQSWQKNKCRGFAVKAGDWDPALLAEWRELAVPRPIPGSDWITCAGIFSADHIDPGSELLTQHLPSTLRGSVADLGAGWGFLSGYLLDHFPEIKEVHLFEADARALDCARKNLSRHGDRVKFHWHDVTQGLSTMKFEAVVMNPPFHTGQDTRIDLGIAFLKTAAAALRMGATLHLVANRHLPYETALTGLELTPHCLQQDSTYKILACQKRR